MPPSFITNRIITPLIKAAKEAGLPFPEMLSNNKSSKNLYQNVNMLPNFGIGRRLILSEWKRVNLGPEDQYVLLTNVQFEKYSLTKGDALGVTFVLGQPTSAVPVRLANTLNRSWEVLPERKEDAPVTQKYQKYKVIHDLEIEEENEVLSKEKERKHELRHKRRKIIRQKRRMVRFKMQKKRR